jgi:hypothetical protein
MNNNKAELTPPEESQNPLERKVSYGIGGAGNVRM